MGQFRDGAVTFNDLLCEGVDERRPVRERGAVVGVVGLEPFAVVVGAQVGEEEECVWMDGLGGVWG